MLLFLLLLSEIWAEELGIKNSGELNLNNYLTSSDEYIASIIVSHNAYLLINNDVLKQSKVLVMSFNNLPEIITTTKVLNLYLSNIEVLSFNQRYIFSRNLLSISIESLMNEDGVVKVATTLNEWYKKKSKEIPDCIIRTHANSRVLALEKSGQGFLIPFYQIHNNDEFGFKELKLTPNTICKKFIRHAPHEEIIYQLITFNDKLYIEVNTYHDNEHTNRIEVPEIVTQSLNINIEVSPNGNYLLLISPNFLILYYVDNIDLLKVKGIVEGSFSKARFLFESQVLTISPKGNLNLYTITISHELIHSLSRTKELNDVTLMEVINNEYILIGTNTHFTIYQLTSNSTSENSLLQWNFVILIIGSILTVFMLGFVIYSLFFSKPHNDSPTQPREEFSVSSEILTTDQQIMSTRGAVQKLLLCPLTHQLPEESVIAADGYTYEKRAIEEWFARNNTSPVTKQQIERKDLWKNVAIDKLIRGIKEIQRPHS